MKDIHIFDIDGTILPMIFPNLQEPDTSIDEIVKIVLERSKSVGLFPEFMTYYSQNCTNGSKNIFLTGRQESAFGDLTRTQLSSLEETSSFKIIFYPEEKSYLSSEYFSWKAHEIQNLFIEHLSQNSDDHYNFMIYDDMTAHFNTIKKIATRMKVEISFRVIKNSSDWIF